MDSSSSASGCLCVACAHESELLLSVTGMTCVTCERTIDNVLMQMEGVSHVAVKLLSGQVVVHYIPDVIQPEQLEEAIEDIGFEAEILQTTALRTSKDVSRAEDKRTLGILLMPSPRSKQDLDIKRVRHLKVDKSTVYVEFSPSEITIDAIRAQCPPGTIISDLRPIETTTGNPSTLQLEVIGHKDELRSLLQGFPNAVDSILFRKDTCIVSYFPKKMGAREILQAVQGLAKHDPSERISADANVDYLNLIASLPWLIFMLAAAIGSQMSTRIYSWWYWPLIRDIPLSTPIILFCGGVIQFHCGIRFHKAAWASIRTRIASMDLLISIALVSNYSVSLIAVFLRITGIVRLLRMETIMQLNHDILMCSILVAALLFGRHLEENAKRKTSVAIRSLRMEEKMIRIRNQSEQAGASDTAKEAETELHPSLLQIRDEVVLRPGDCSPCDGFVIEGEAQCDEALLTGEPALLPKSIGAFVLEGSTIAEGFIVLRATDVGEDTTLSQIRQLMEQAQLEPPKIQRLASAISAVFVPVTLIIAACTLVIWTIIVAADLMNEDVFEDDFDRILFVIKFGLSVLLIACPCSFGLATPTAIMVATGVSAKFGCLVKSGRTYETCRQIKNVVLDKTGTITLGRPQVIETRLLPKFEDKEERFLCLLASAERFSEHPLGKTLAKLSPNADLPVLQWRNITGVGIECLIENLTVRVSTLDPDAIMTWSSATKGATFIGMTVNDELWGAVALRDGVKPSAQKLIHQLQKEKIQVWMCTGDAEEAANEVAQTVGIPLTHVRAKQTPEDKAALVDSLDDVLMVGDGINDAIALAKADVGVAIGCGNHITMDSADIVILKDSLGDLSSFFKLSRAVVRTIYRNFVWAFGFNIIGIPLAAGVGYPFGITLPPMLAGMMMATSSILVVSSSLLLYRFKPVTDSIK